MVARHLKAALLRAARRFPVVTVTGPRQSGKTTLVRSAFPRHAYVSLEMPDERRFALDDPRGFLARFDGPAILDEVQRAPDLFSYIQGLVDAGRGRNGRFILTGSQNFLLMSRVSQSLAGRCAVLHLLPFSRAELAGERMRDITAALRSPRRRARPAGGADLFATLFAGGYPRIHDRKLDPGEWLGNYYQTYVERDVRDILNVGDIETFGRFVGLCAGRAGQLLNLASLAADCGITHPTARKWISVLEASFIVTLLRPYHENFSKRLVKSPKLYFLDAGLLCWLLRIRKPEDLALHASRGAVFESWTVSETIKNFLHRGARPEAFFWRDNVGHEVDLVLDSSGGPIPVEIKSGQTFSPDFVSGLDWWREASGKPGMAGAVLYGGDPSFDFKSDRVVSWSEWA
jgi:uncharacterized protein